MREGMGAGGSAMWNWASSVEMGRGRKVGREWGDVLVGGWMTVPIIVVGMGRRGLGMRSGGIFEVRAVGWMLAFDEGGGRGLDGVLERCLLVVKNWLGRGSCGMKSSAWGS